MNPGSLDVQPVAGRAATKAFVNLPWRIYRGDTNWVGPLKRQVMQLLDPSRHPYWRFSKRQLFLAQRGREPVGRIAAIVDDNFNRHHGERMGAWGFFESEDSPETAAALFKAAEQWLKNLGMTSYVGPYNPSINYEIGLLIRGFESPPALGFTYNPPYYQELVRLCGHKKDKDLFTHRITWKNAEPEWLAGLGEKLRRQGEITVRAVDLRRFEQELELMREIYNESWADNWRAVPMTQEEILEVGREMRTIADPDLAFFLYFRGEPAGVSITLPDVNRLLQRLDGKLRPWILLKHLLIRSEVVGLRGYILGIKKPFRQLGLPLVAFHHTVEVLKTKPQYRYLETGWELEDNDAINKLYEDVGVKPSSRIYRVYLKQL